MQPTQSRLVKVPATTETTSQSARGWQNVKSDKSNCLPMCFVGSAERNPTPPSSYTSGVAFRTANSNLPGDSAESDPRPKGQEEGHVLG